MEQKSIIQVIRDEAQEAKYKENAAMCRAEIENLREEIKEYTKKAKDHEKYADDCIRALKLAGFNEE